MSVCTGDERKLRRRKLLFIQNGANHRSRCVCVTFLLFTQFDANYERMKDDDDAEYFQLIK